MRKRIGEIVGLAEYLLVMAIMLALAAYGEWIAAGVWAIVLELIDSKRERP